MRGENVRDLQTYLARISTFITEIPTIAVDGIYGPATSNAVRIFQRLYKIPVSGSVGPVTWFNIAREYDLSYE
jgi:peptidoglycan hydrolase-like protein with peptidoglycan-binding domain